MGVEFTNRKNTKMRPGSLLRLAYNLSVPKILDWENQQHYYKMFVELKPNDLVLCLGLIPFKNFVYVKLLYGEEILYCEDFILEKAVIIEVI